MNAIRINTTQTQTQPCNCGCAECQSESCQLECAVQPRFFYGQVLNDSDLTQIIAWTQSKLRLNRFRDGWGVVCGLEVACNCSTGAVASVTVSPGYALDACGNDLVLCQKQCVDLTSVLPSNQSYCATPSKGAKPNLTKPNSMKIPLSSLAANDVYCVDLYAHYEEEGSSPQTVYGRDNCRSLGQCENSRTTEAVRIVPVLVPDDMVTPDERRLDNWKQHVGDYRALMDLLQKKIPNGSNADIKNSLTEWFKDHPLHHFCFVSDWGNSLTGESISIERQVRAAKNWLDVLEKEYADLSTKLAEAQKIGNKSAVDELKEPLKNVEVDLKEARRRYQDLVNLAELQHQLQDAKNDTKKQQDIQKRIDALYAKYFERNLADELSEALKWIVLDELIFAMQCNCASLKSDQTDVPVARVWVQVMQERTGKSYRVLAVDDKAPFRRSLGLDCLPAPYGKHNLAHLIGCRPEEAFVEAKRLGIELTLSDAAALTNLSIEELKNIKAEDMWVASGHSVTAHVVNLPLYDLRVVRFTPGN